MHALTRPSFGLDDLDLARCARPDILAAESLTVGPGEGSLVGPLEAIAASLEDNIAVFNGQTISVRGRFERNYMTGDVVDLQACGTTALVLDERYTRRLLQALLHSH